MESSIIGKLQEDSSLGWGTAKDYVSIKGVSTPFFDNQKISYRFDFNNSPDITIEDSDLALANFFNFNSSLKEDIAQKAFKSWQDFNEAVGLLDNIGLYRSEKNRPEWMENSLKNIIWLEKLTEPQKVWEYLTPSEILITKDRFKKKKGIYIQILCKCAWDDEHGLQIVLMNGEHLTRVSEQDGNLFEHGA